MSLSREEKEQYIKDFMGRVQESLLDKLDRVPEHWTGLELRGWIADTFDHERRAVLSPWSVKEYRNDVITLNL